jgi:spore germination protein YaaH
MTFGGVLGATTAALVAATVTLSVPVSTRAADLPVFGFQSDGSPTSVIGMSAAALGSVGVDGLNLTGPGRVSVPTSQDRAQLFAAHRAGLPAVLLVGNFSDRINDFSEPLAHATLGRPPAIARVVDALATNVRAGGWNGISVDLESLTVRDRPGLAAFVAGLRHALPTDDSLTVTVMNETSPGDYRSAGYDLAALARSADQLVLMAYDQHGPWENTPGPIGALAWQRAGLHAILEIVPAAKVDLGVAGYGYAWRPHANLQLSDAGARRLVARSGAHARWVPSAGEWTATLPDGSTVWWSDRRSLALRLRLAASIKLHGLAVWSLGLSDPITA